MTNEIEIKLRTSLCFSFKDFSVKYVHMAGLLNNNFHIFRIRKASQL
jgi:hypothetical protein